MYSSTHGVVGATIMLAAPNPIVGGALAFASHFALDYVQEGSVPTKKSAVIESGLLVAFLLACNSWLAVAGWVLGNLPDLIDKPRRWFFGKKEWFSCHNGRGFLSLGAWKFGYPTIVTLTTAQTLALNIGLTAAWVIFMTCA